MKKNIDRRQLIVWGFVLCFFGYSFYWTEIGAKSYASNLVEPDHANVVSIRILPSLYEGVPEPVKAELEIKERKTVTEICDALTKAMDVQITGNRTKVFGPNRWHCRVQLEYDDKTVYEGDVSKWGDACLIRIFTAGNIRRHCGEYRCDELAHLIEQVAAK